MFLLSAAYDWRIKLLIIITIIFTITLGGGMAEYWRCWVQIPLWIMQANKVRK